MNILYTGQTAYSDGHYTQDRQPTVMDILYTGQIAYSDEHFIHRTDSLQ